MDATAEKLVIPGLAFLSVTAVGASILLWKAQKQKSFKIRMRDGIPTAADTTATGQKQKSRLVQLLEKVGNIVSHGHASTSLWDELIRAGYYSKAAPAIYTGTKMSLFILGLVSAAIFVLPSGYNFPAKINFIFMGGIVPFFVPNILLKLRLRKRYNEICLHLPDAVDLLEICVSSGIGLSMAWNIVADEIQHVSSTLAGAMALTNFEIHLGISRIDAMRHMADRTGVDKLSSLAATLVQTERFGTSIAAALKEYAQSMREERYFAAEESAEKMAVKLVIPMVLFIFPAVMIVVAGPAVISIYKMMASY